MQFMKRGLQIRHGKEVGSRIFGHIAFTPLQGRLLRKIRLMCRARRNLRSPAHLHSVVHAIYLCYIRVCDFDLAKGEKSDEQISESDKRHGPFSANVIDRLYLA